MNKNDLTYAAFLDGLRVIQAEGLTPSVRLSALVSAAPIPPWLSFSAAGAVNPKRPKQIDENISPTLSDAIKAEFGRIAQIVRADSAAQLAKAQDEVREISDLLKESDRNLARSESQNQETSCTSIGIRKKTGGVGSAAIR